MLADVESHYKTLSELNAEGSLRKTRARANVLANAGVPNDDPTVFLNRAINRVSQGNPANSAQVRSDQPNQNAETAKVARNNPGNIKDAKTGEFREFSSYKDGVKAVENQIGLYMSGKSQHAKGTPLLTVRDILSKYRPASDRRGDSDISQEAYENRVAQALGVSPTDTLTYDQDTISKITSSIISVEQGATSNSGITIPSKTAPTKATEATVESLREELRRLRAGRPLNDSVRRDIDDLKKRIREASK
jgi:hypothetical protein